MIESLRPPPSRPVRQDRCASGSVSVGIPGDDVVLSALRVLAERHRLSPTLEERLIEIGAGLAYRDIAARHGLSENTIKNEARYLLEILGLNCRHLIDSAVRAASIRFQDTAEIEPVIQFLELRLE